MTCKVRSGPAALAAELCRAGIWERAEGGYRSLDAEAVQVRADRVRELREHDAWLAGLPGGARSEPATGAAGTTRFGGRVAKGAAASFQCGQCGEVAGVVRVARAGGAGPGTEPMLRSGSPGLVAQELAAWAVGTGLARGVVLDAALAAAPAGKGRRAGLAVRPRDLSFARAVRAVLSAIRLGHACYQEGYSANSVEVQPGYR